MSGRKTRLRASLQQVAERASDFAEVVLAPGGLRAMATKPRSVAAFRLTSGIAASGVRPRTVIDVGANIGQFSAAALARWPSANLIVFEPLPEAAAKLRALLPSDRVVVHEKAAGSTDGKVLFHRHRYSLSSSVLKSSPEACSRYPWAEEVDEAPVSLRRLDSTVGDPSGLPRPALLKLDVQGFELEALEGAEGVLPYLDAIVVEHSFERFYEGQPSFEAVHGWLRDRGWALTRVLDTRREAGICVEADALYMPTTPTVDAPAATIGGSRISRLL